MIRSFYPLTIALFLLCSCLTGPLRAQTAADSAGSKGARLLPLPILFYTPETRLAGGASLLYFYRDSGADQTLRPSTVSLLAIYTQERQFTAQLGGELYPLHGLYRIEGSILGERYPSKFFGIGNFTASAQEEAYTVKRLGVDLSVMRHVVDGARAGVVVRWEKSSIVNRMPGGLLAGGTVPGGTESTVSGAGVQVSWDTRENIFAPTSGNFTTASVVSFGRFLGGTNVFTKFKLDARQYVAPMAEQVLALQFIGVLIDGTAPFRELARVGGSSTLRGYYEGRYRDDDVAVLQAEYRVPIIGRLGAVAFAGAGEVAHRPGDFSLRGLWFAGGIGLRFAYNPTERLNIRLDMGWGNNSSGLYITAGEAF